MNVNRFSTWRTKSGQDIDIKDMTDKHIQNAINFINKRQEETDKEITHLGISVDIWKDAFEQELEYRDRYNKHIFEEPQSQLCCPHCGCQLNVKISK